MRNPVSLFFTLAAALSVALPAVAAERAALPDGQPLPRGRVVAIDETSGSVTLEYQPIPHLFLEGGTRTFAVDDRGTLDGIAPGSKVRFDVERAGKRYTVTHLENSN